MRHLAALVIVLLVAVVGWFALRSAAPVPLGSARPHSATEAEAMPQVMSRSAAPLLVAQSLPEDLGIEITACLKVVESGTGAPISGAAVYRFDERIQSAPITYTDVLGLASLPLKKPEQLIVASSGYLLRLAPTQLGSSPQNPQQVQLLRDRYSLRVSFRFVMPNGEPAEEVLARFTPLVPQQGNELPLPASLLNQDEVAKRAWLEQRIIASARPVPEVHVQVGQYNQQQVFVFGAEEDVSFAAASLMQLEAATRSGFVAKATFDPAAASAEPMTIRLLAGRAIDGYVRSAVTGAPVAGAEIATKDSEPLQLTAISDAAGHFVLTPLANGMVTLTIRHRDHEIGFLGPLAAGSSDVQVLLALLPKGSLRGRVRGRPTLQPIAFARVSSPVQGAAPDLAIADQDGYFVLRGSVKQTVRVVIIAEGYQPYSELLEPGAPLLDFDVWPADTAVRVRAKMTASVIGVVLDGNGIRRPGATVRLIPDQPLPLPELPHRRVLIGSTLMLPTSVSSGPDGRFEIETQCPGPCTLMIFDPLNSSGPPRMSKRVELQLGESLRDIELTLREP
ncbi:hypothetical protein LBMAG49_07250 [Planctomycetota bacterium]|nr:hypothetical protein LBMAG49_07250 [Planctomycetota bacterium]